MIHLSVSYISLLMFYMHLIFVQRFEHFNVIALYKLNMITISQCYLLLRPTQL